jgi:hypothetical protein
MATRKRDSLITETLRNGISAGLLAQVRVTAEVAGEALAREWLDDPEFKAEMKAIGREILADLRKR